MDTGIGNSSSTTAPRQLLLRCPNTVRPVHMRCPNTTTMDGESADIAGANICPSIHEHMHCPGTCHPWQYPPV